jgi:hypothetical protein
MNDRLPRAANSACLARRGTSPRVAIHRRLIGEAIPPRATAARPTVAEDNRRLTTARTAGLHRATAADHIAVRRLHRRLPMTAARTDAPHLRTAADPMDAARRRHLLTADRTDAALHRTVAAVLAAEAGHLAAPTLKAELREADRTAEADTPQPPATTPAAVVEAAHAATAIPTAVTNLTFTARHTAFGRRFFCAR